MIAKLPWIRYFIFIEALHNFFQFFWNKYQTADTTIHVDEGAFYLGEKFIVSGDFLDEYNF